MKKTAILPGGFKPPHAGHYAVAKHLAKKSGADVIVRVGSGERDGITQNISIKIWEMYGFKAKPAASDSPITDVFKYVEKEAEEGEIVYVGTGEKDFPRFKVLTDPSFKPKNYKKYNPKNIKVIEIPVPPQAGGIAGKIMRGFIKNNDKKSFQNNLPDHVNKDKIWNIVKGLDEDFYDPRNKYYDFAKSSEWKAGYKGKKDIPRTKDQIHNRQTAPVSWEESIKGNKTLHAYDFDDTIARVKANIKVYITSPNGEYSKELLIPAEKFPEESKELEARLGNLEIEYDFSEFSKQIGDAIINTGVVNKLKASLSKPDIKTTILTARSVGHPVTRYMREELGLAAYVVPLGAQVKGKVTGQDKADWIENHINKGYKTVYFIDDSEENRTAVAALKDKHPDVNLTVEDPAAVNEMMGMMTKQEKAKHAKNMKRLSKDMSNMKGNNYGGGGYKVPDYVKGTLTRKLYDENFPPYVANQVQQTRYKASDTFTRDVKKSKKMGYKESAFTKKWWKEIINEVLLKEGGAAGHMAHPFDLSSVKTGKDLKNVIEKTARSLEKNPGAVKIDGINSSIRLVDLDGKKQFVMDRGSKMALDVKGITKSDLGNRFKPGHGMIKVGGEVLDMFNEALPSLKKDLIKLGAWKDPNILFNMEYVEGKTNVQKYDNNFVAIHGLNKIEMVNEPSEKTGKILSKRKSTEISYNKNDLQSLVNNLSPVAKKRGFEVYGTVATTMKKKPNFGSALAKNYSIKTSKGNNTKSLNQLLDSLDNIPKKDFIFMDGIKRGAVSKIVYTTLLNGGNIDELFESEEDKELAIKGFTTYLATEMLGQEVLKVLDSPMGTVDTHEGVVIRDKKIADVPFKLSGAFIRRGMTSDF
jgi:hypothetical protein